MNVRMRFHVQIPAKVSIGDINVCYGNFWPGTARCSTTCLSRPMTKNWRNHRESFRHGNLPEALIAAALQRLEDDGQEAISLRELSRDVGVNHRAIYRHFPDRLSLMARVAEEGWRLLGATMRSAATSQKPGTRSLVAAGVALFVFARNRPNLFALMGGPNFQGRTKFPALDRSIGQTLELLRQGFLAAGTSQDAALKQALIYASALQGVVGQILWKRYRVLPKNAEGEVGRICEMLIKGLR